MPNNRQINPNNEVLISVCIATYKRPALLEILLLSLKNQYLPSEVKLEIVVTDNDIETSAKNILEKFSDTEKIYYKYFVQPEKNISLTRNKCVENATGDFICFIDDDETASELWIKNLHDAAIRYDADGVFGYVEPIFDKNIPIQFHKREFYFSPVGETGTEALFYFTTNAIVKTALIKSENVPFDPGYGLTGGEDSHLFERLERKGAKFIVSRDAVSYENIPVERGTMQYLFNRALRGGQAFIRRKLESNKKITNQLSIMTKALTIILYSSMLFIILSLSKYQRIKYIQFLGASIGKLRTLLGFYKILH